LFDRVAARKLFNLIFLAAIAMKIVLGGSLSEPPKTNFMAGLSNALFPIQNLVLAEHKAL